MRGGGYDLSISIARFVAMVMIISCHMFSYYKSELALWLNVGVQVFFVISGFLYGNKVDIGSPIEFITRNFKKILLPYWVFLVLAVLAYYCLCRETLSLSTTIRAFTCSGTIDGLGHLWFVGYILFCYFLTPYLFWLKKYTEERTVRNTIVIYIILFISIQLIGFLFDSYFAPDKISCYVAGFFLADLFHRLTTRQASYLKWMIFIIALMMNASEIYIKYFTDISFIGWQNTMFRALCRYSHMFLGIAIFLSFYGKFKKCKYSTLIKYSDRYSYPVYLVHQLFILSPLTLMAISDIKFMNWILVIVAICISGVFLYHLSGFIENRIKCPVQNNRMDG